METEASDSNPGPELFTAPATGGPAPAGGPSEALEPRPSPPGTPLKRSALVRMKKIFGWLQDGLYPNRFSIARELEVSPKTAGRKGVNDFVLSGLRI